MRAYLLAVFILANTVNLLAAAMFLARVLRPSWARLLGNLALLMGLPALLLSVQGWRSGYQLFVWLPPLLWAVFALFGLVVDVILQIEFRQPQRWAILGPFLLLFYLPLIMMWGMTWLAGVPYWAITGLTYFAMLAASFYASRRGVG